jgi:hypothetical protein
MIKKTNARHGDFYIFEKDIYISRCLDLYGEWSEAEMMFTIHSLKKIMLLLK